MLQLMNCKGSFRPGTIIFHFCMCITSTSVSPTNDLVPFSRLQDMLKGAFVMLKAVWHYKPPFTCGHYLSLLLLLLLAAAAKVGGLAYLAI